MDDRGWLFEANALILSKLNINPEKLSDEEWVHSVFMALWIESRYFERLSKLLLR